MLVTSIILLFVGMVMVWTPGIDIELVKKLPGVDYQNYMNINWVFISVGGVLVMFSLLIVVIGVN